METPYVYPRGTERFWGHRDCTMNLSGTHRGNRYCVDHGVLVAEPTETEETCMGTLWHPVKKEV